MTERPNGPTKEEAEEIVHQIEGYAADLRAEKALYMNRCKPLHEAIRDTIEEAVKTKGFDKKALKVTVKQRDYLRKMEALENELDEVTQTALDRLQLQLGTFADSPLGRAAMDAVRDRPTREATMPKPRRGRKRDPIAEMMDGAESSEAGEPAEAD